MCAPSNAAPSRITDTARGKAGPADDHGSGRRPSLGLAGACGPAGDHANRAAGQGEHMEDTAEPDAILSHAGTRRGGGGGRGTMCHILEHTWGTR